MTCYPPNQCIFIGNLPNQVPLEHNKEGLHRLFSMYGQILSLNVKVDQADRPIGFILFSSVEEATMAYERGQGQHLFGRLLRIEYSNPNRHHHYPHHHHPPGEPFYEENNNASSYVPVIYYPNDQFVYQPLVESIYLYSLMQSNVKFIPEQADSSKKLEQENTITNDHLFIEKTMSNSATIEESNERLDDRTHHKLNPNAAPFIPKNHSI